MINNQVFKGFLIGLFAPVAAFVVYVAFFTDSPSPLQLLKQLFHLDLLTHVISLSTLINLLIFYMKITTNRDVVARGIVMATFFYAFLVVILIVI